MTNRKPPERQGKVQLIDATTFCVPMRRSLGDKRREIPLERAQDILQFLADSTDGDTRTVSKDGKSEEIVVSRIFPATHFGFRKITVERPLRLSFQATPERIARLEQEKGFQALATSRKKGDAGAKEIAAGRALQEQIRALVNDLPEEPFPDREEFEKLLSFAAEHAGMKLTAPARKAILAALGERDENAEICTTSDVARPSPTPSCATPKAFPCRQVPIRSTTRASPPACRRSSIAR